MAQLLRRVTFIILVMAAAFATPVLTPSVPASADTVIDGCTVVSNPTPTHFTGCAGKDLSSASFKNLNLSYANFSGANFVACQSDFPPPPPAPLNCVATGFGGSNLTRANFTGATLNEFVAVSPPLQIGDIAVDFANDNLTGVDLMSTDAGLVDFTNANLSGADLAGTDLAGAKLTNSNLTGATLTGASMSGSTGEFPVPFPATLTGANLTGTILVSSNQSVTATSQAGAVATWPTPAGIPGATPGSCTPPSGSTFPLFTTIVTCQVLDANADVATGTFQVTVQPTTQYFTRIALPSGGAVLTGSTNFDALAGDAPGVTNVVFELTGGSLNDQVIATATPTLYGWLAQWNSSTVPNGTYSLQSVATDAANDTDASSPVTVTVTNHATITAVLIPSGGASLLGTSSLVDASASSPNGIASVTFEMSGGALSDHVVATAAPTPYGWLAQWDTTRVPNGTYILQSVATDTHGLAGTSAPVSVTVANAPPTTNVLIPLSTSIQSGAAAVLDASASSGVSQVTYELSGGPSNLTDQVIATGTPTYYGWLAQWNTTTVPNGSYELRSVATYAGGVSGSSQVAFITVSN